MNGRMDRQNFDLLTQPLTYLLTHHIVASAQTIGWTLSNMYHIYDTIFYPKPDVNVDSPLLPLVTQSMSPFSRPFQLNLSPSGTHCPLWLT